MLSLLASPLPIGEMILDQEAHSKLHHFFWKQVAYGQFGNKAWFFLGSQFIVYLWAKPSEIGSLRTIINPPLMAKPSEIGSLRTIINPPLMAKPSEIGSLITIINPPLTLKKFYGFLICV
jgi:hypothetical protein